MERLKKPVFAKDEKVDLFQQLRQEVNNLVEDMQPRKHKEIQIKAILFPIMYISAYVIALYYAHLRGVYYLCYMLMGALLVINFLNLIHEAVHNTLFKSKFVNSLYVHFFDLMGANSFIWKVRHIRLHHNYPNVMGWDSDVEQSPMARIFPYGPFSKMHKYQHIYLPLIYPLYLFNWLLVRDFKDFFNKSKLVWKVTTIPTIEYIKLFVFKAAFIFYTIFAPVLFLDVSWTQSILGFIFMMFSASIISLLVLLSPHANTESEFLLPDDAGKLPMSWFMHQLTCTNDVEEDNWFIRFFMGSFNYHIAHHLFPHVNHIYYPEVTKRIERFAINNDLPYKRFPLATSLRNHYHLLRVNAVHENIFEETM